MTRKCPEHGIVRSRARFCPSCGQATVNTLSRLVSLAKTAALALAVIAVIAAIVWGGYAIHITSQQEHQQARERKARQDAAKQEEVRRMRQEIDDLPKDGEYTVVTGELLVKGSKQLDGAVIRLDGVLMELNSGVYLSSFESRDRKFPFAVKWGGNPSQINDAKARIRELKADKRAAKLRLYGRWVHSDGFLTTSRELIVDKWFVVEWQHSDDRSARDAAIAPTPLSLDEPAELIGSHDGSLEARQVERLPKDGNYTIVSGITLKELGVHLSGKLVRIDGVLMNFGNEDMFVAASNYSRFESRDRELGFSVEWGRDRALATKKRIRKELNAHKPGSKFRLYGRWLYKEAGFLVSGKRHLITDKWNTADW